jgi:predicted DNA repair protein MutK
MMSLWTLLDDMAGLMDDIGAMSKVAAKKTVGVVGDDIAVNAEQLTGSSAERELPIVWAVFKGSLINKLILVPIALLLEAFAAWALGPILIVGGTYLCFEAFEKLLHAPWPGRKPQLDAAAHGEPKTPLSERDKIKGAIRTDFILSGEIIMIALAAIGDAPIATTIFSVSLLALGMTVFVYGLVALLVKFDDVGLALTRRDSAFAHALGRTILWSAPALMKLLALVGTAAMFAVGGGLLVHHVAPLHHAVVGLIGEQSALSTALADAVVGVALGAAAFAVVTVGGRLFGRRH